MGGSDRGRFARRPGVTKVLLHASPVAALLPAALPIYTDLVSKGLTHRWAMSPRSSQAFALNLFAPLRPPGVLALFGLLGLPAAGVESPVFEYSDPLDRLEEARPNSPNKTQVDVLLRGVSPSGERLVALVEVKFTETDFGHCSAYDNPANPHRDVCRSAGLFGGEPARCFQLSNYGHGRRRYDELLASVPVQQPSGADDDGGCLVRRSLSQPMRNLAQAHLLIADGEADRVVYVLCAPEAHPTIWRRFAELRAAFPDVPERTLRAATAEQVATLHCDSGAGLAALCRLPEIPWTQHPEERS
jgi:hypothetical protein